MTRTALLFLTLFGLTARAHAQEPAPADGEATPEAAPAPMESPETTVEDAAGDATERGWRPSWFGGFGFASVGIGVIQIERLGSALERAGALGDGAAPGLVSWQIGGGGRLLLWDFIIGGKGFFNYYYNADTPQGSARTVLGGGGLDVGYAVLNRDHLMLYPFLGFGGMGVGLELRNATDGDISFGEQTIGMNSNRDYTAGIFYAELGMGLQWFFHDGTGGFNVGVEAGVLSSLGGTRWSDDEYVDVLDVERPGLMGGYLKLTVGGGGFMPEE